MAHGIGADSPLARAPRDRWERSAGEQADHGRSSSDRSGASFEQEEGRSPDSWLLLQRAIQSRLGNGWLGRVQAAGPRSAWDLQVLHLLQVAQETGLDVSGFLPWNAAPSWNQALEPYYRVLLHELHGGAAGEAGPDSVASFSAPSVADVLGAELMGELGLADMGGLDASTDLGPGPLLPGFGLGLDSPGLGGDLGVEGLAARRADGAAADPLTEHMSVLLDRAGAGRSLTEPEQAFLERVHGQRFSGVRLHEGPEAHAAARAIAARAFTLGSDIYMGSNLSLDSAQGAELLAHEATHVKQAAEGRLPSPKGGGFEVSSPHQSYEKEAEAIGHAGAALRQVELGAAGARPDPADLSWFTSRFGGLLSDQALDAVLSDGPGPVERSTQQQAARELVRDVLVDQACSAWVSANSAMGAMAAGLNPAHATALGLLQQSLSAAFSQAIAAAQDGRLDGLSRLAALTGVSPEALVAQLPAEASMGGRALGAEVRTLVGRLQPVAPSLRVLGQEVDVSGLVSGQGIAAAAASLVSAEVGADADVVQLDWAVASEEALADVADSVAELDAPETVGQDWQLADVYQSVDPVGRAIVASLQAALPAPAPEAPAELLEQGLLRHLQANVAGSASQLQAQLESWLEESGDQDVNAELLAGVRGALAGLRAVGEAELAPSPENLGTLQALGGSPGADGLQSLQSSFAPYPDFAERAADLAGRTAPEVALTLPLGGFEVDGPDLLSVGSGEALGAELSGPSMDGPEASGGESATGPALFRKASPGAAAVDTADPAVDRALGRRGAGVPLPLGIRAALETHLGVDLGHVRVHLGSEADAAAKAVKAEAFATGSDIFFQEGTFDLSTAEGRELVAHEVAHTVQSSGAAATGRRVSDPGEAAEIEADRIAESFVQGEALVSDTEAIAGLDTEGAALDALAPEGMGLGEEGAAPVLAEAAEGVLHRRPEDDEDQNTDPTDIKEQAEKEGDDRELSEEEIEEEIKKAQKKGEDKELPEEDEEKDEEEECLEESTEESKEESTELGGNTTGTQTSSPVSTPAGGGGGEPVPYGQAKSSVVSKYASEKAWHDQWKSGGAQVGVGMSSGADMAMDAMIAGGLEGGMTAVSNIVVDTLLNKATKNIPYASGFIAMFEMGKAGGPGPWLQGQFANESGTGIGDLMGKGVKGISEAEDWIDVLDGVINILDSLNKIIGLASTICFIVAAAGFIASFICPALIPFVAMAAKWGLLLGEISTLVGIGITAFRGISMLARAAQVARGDADPETQIKRAEKLRAQTETFTAEYATRKANSARQKKQKQSADKKSGAKPGGGGDSGSATAKNGVAKSKTRKEKVLSALSTVSKVATGGDAVKQTRTVGAHAEHTGAMTKTVVGASKNGGAGLKGEGGKQTIATIQQQDAHFNEKHAGIDYNAQSISDPAAKRANDQFNKQESAAKLEAAKTRLATAEANYQQAKANLGKKNTDLDAAQAAERKARQELENARIGKQMTDEHFSPLVGQQKQVLGAAEETARTSTTRYNKAQSALDGEKAALDAKKAKLAAFKQVIDQTENPPPALLKQYGQEASAVGDAEIAFLQNKGAVDQLRIASESDHRRVKIQQEHLQRLTAPGSESKDRLNSAQGGLHEAQQNKSGAKGEVELAQNRTNAAKNRQSQAYNNERDRESAFNSASDQASLKQRTLDAGGNIKDGMADTAAGFKRQNWWDNADGSDVPASGYGHQGTGGVTGAGVDTAKGLMGQAADATGLSSVTNTVGAATESVMDFADVSADPNKDADAAAAKEQFVQESKARMDASFSSMTSELQAPPSSQEGVLDEQAGVFDSRTAEIDQLSEQLKALEELKAENETEKAALQTGQQVVEGMVVVSEVEKQTNVQKRTAQDNLKQTAQQQLVKGTETKDKQAEKLGPIMDFVSGFARLMGIIPTRLIGGKGGADAGEQVGTGVTKMGEGADTSKAKAEEDKATAEDFSQKTDQADATADEVKTQNQTMKTGMAEDMVGALSADADLAEAQSTATSRISEANAEKAAALASWQAAVGTMNGWAGSHEAARTGGQANIDTTLDDVEKRLGQQAAK